MGHEVKIRKYKDGSLKGTCTTPSCAFEVYGPKGTDDTVHSNAELHRTRTNR